MAVVEDIGWVPLVLQLKESRVVATPVALSWVQRCYTDSE